MGNCQAVETAALVIQFPSGKAEKLYWPISASDVMEMNPGHYVSLIIPGNSTKDVHRSKDKGVRSTHVKLLRSNETLVLGKAYRLVTTEEVLKVLREKSYEKMRMSRRYSDYRTLVNPLTDSDDKAISEELEGEKTSQSMRHERNRQRPTPAKFAMRRSKSWCPSLKSISEGGTLNNKEY